MNRLALIAGLMWASAATAQGVPQEGWHLTLKNEQWAYIRSLLALRPFDEVAPLMSDVVRQMNTQLGDARAAAQADEQKRVDEAVKKALDEAKKESKPDAPVDK